MFRVEDCAEDIWLDRGGDTNYIATIWKDDCARHGIDPADDAACFREIRPVLRELGCAIEEYPSDTGTSVLLFIPCRTQVAFRPTYALATCAALVWASENMPEELRAAREVSACI